MQGPPRTPPEIAALLARGAERLEALGVMHDRAVEEVATEHGVASERVEQLLARYGYASRKEAVMLS